MKCKFIGYFLSLFLLCFLLPFSHAAPVVNESFDSFAKNIPAQVELEIFAFDTRFHYGKNLGFLPAWSTSKVPVSLAALQAGSPVTPAMKSAITVSNNSAAQEVWESLGSNREAASKTQEIIRQAGDEETIVPDKITRVGFTIFGQTKWPVPNQALFAAKLPCLAKSGPIIKLMEEIETGAYAGGFGLALSQKHGIATKSGWGPGKNGKYLVRQFGTIFYTPASFIGFSMAVLPDDGQFISGTKILNQLGAWILRHKQEFTPSGCSAAGS